MKKLFVCLALLLSAPSLILSQTRDALWQQVHEAETQRLPQTAIAALDQLVAQTLAEKAYPEAAKAIAERVRFQTEIQGGQPQVAIREFTTELENAPTQLQPILQTFLANAYWRYFQQNRYRIMRRSHTSTPPSSDFETWDLPRLLQEIDIQFSAALENETQLQSVTADQLGRLLETDTPDPSRPTLYDVVLYEALDFYQAGEQGAIAPEDRFELKADSPAFDPAADFLAWQLPTTNDYSPQLKALRLYQDLLHFHAQDADRSAYLNADLARIEYAKNAATGENKQARYPAALEHFLESTQDHEIFARASWLLARYHHAADAPGIAHQIATRGHNAYPESDGGKLCLYLIKQIEAPSVSFSTESVWNDPRPTLDIKYRNVSKIYFRAIPVDIEKALTGQVELDEPKQLLAAPTALEWFASLPATPDFRDRAEKLPAPKDLAPGYYFILSNDQADWSHKESVSHRALICISDLALVLNENDNKRGLSGLLLEANSGQPISNAEIKVWDDNRQPLPSLRTDENGQFFAPKSWKDQSVSLLAKHRGHVIAPHDFSSDVYFEDNEYTPYPQTVFFTDRALYRPGQSIHFKGIHYHANSEENTYQTLPNRDVTVAFYDANRQIVDTADFTTNDYGSFSGSFTAPSTGRLGMMRIGGGRGQATFHVEEYKRPKFEVTLSPPTEAPQLGEPTQVTGQALAYSGAAIGNAKLSWRVERTPQMPYWCWWWRPSPAQAIAHGIAETQADGSFSIAFDTLPDLAIPRANEPVFNFRITTDITDSNGETRSATSNLRVGYASLEAALSLPEWLPSKTPIPLDILTKSLDGQPQPSQGSLKIYRLKQPDTVQRPALKPRYSPWQRQSSEKPEYDPENPDTWKTETLVSTKPYTAAASGTDRLELKLPAGAYRAELQTQDRFGQTVSARQSFIVIDPRKKRFATAIPHYLAFEKTSYLPGETLQGLWGTGYRSGQAFVEIQQNGEVLESYWTPKNRSQQSLSLPITESMRGGITLTLSFVRENRAYIESHVINVPWSNKRLSIQWETFRSKLEPGQNEIWTAKITGPDAKQAAAEMVAGLYDASLDAFRPHRWPDLDSFRKERSRGRRTLQNRLRNFELFRGPPNPPWPQPHRGYAGFENFNLSADDDQVFELSPFSIDASSDQGYRASKVLAGSRARTQMMDIGNAAPPPPEPDLSQVSARHNLNETAFFFPHLETDEYGSITLSFTMPEALTRWRFFGFAHDSQLRHAFLQDTAVTAKDLMVEPNPPRFLREGDQVEFTVKVSNQSDQAQNGRLRLTFADAATLESLDTHLKNLDTEKALEVPAKESRSYSWRITVPDGARVLTYKAIGASADLSDGEEGYLPIISRRILVTESLPLPLRGKGQKDFTFDKLIASENSDTLQHQSLNVQMVSQPAWYAVMALPYLMEYQHECSEQLFNRYYANQLARHIANSQPKIRRTFDLWKNTPALDSPLEKNETLKSVLIEETPWLRAAKTESQARRKVGILFDENRLNDESTSAFNKLARRQLSDGRWPWFTGGKPDNYITLYITTGFGRMRQLGIEIDPTPAIKSLAALDSWIHKQYTEIHKRPNPENYIPSHHQALYLYGRSFFLRDQAITPEHRIAVDFFLQQARRHWTHVGNRQTEAHLALALHRFGNNTAATTIVDSLRQRSVQSEERGMHWRDTENSWWWYLAPIETQALMIEAFDEIAQDQDSVENCKVWLLKQKQTQNWKTTKATADATYALLLRGEDLLASDDLVAIKLGETQIEPETPEAGTGFYQKTFTKEEIAPQMGNITTLKTDDGVSWGSIHWQYLEDMEKVTPHEGTPLTLKKTLYIKKNTPSGPTLFPIDDSLQVGDELVVRLELRSDRDMEYLHLKDRRASGVEPVNVLSRYKYQDGLGYYESTRDTASHFFIEHLRKGTYVFEYSVRVQLKGQYQSGLAEIQCMYAPEFNSHSASTLLKVNES